MQNRIRPAALLGALALLLTACGGAAAKPPAETTAPSTSVETTALIETTAPVGQGDSITIAGEAPPQITFTQTYARYEAEILCQAGEPTFEEIGERLSLGEAARDEMVELLLDVNLTREMVSDMPAEVERRAQAGESPDVLEFARAADAASLAPRGYLADLHAMPGLRLDHPAFDGALNDMLTVAGHTYFLFGDATVGDKAATAVLFVDPNAAAEADISADELLEAVRSGAWTTEQLLTYAAQGSLSLDGEDMVSLFLASGGEIFTRNAQGVPELTAGEPFSRAYAAMQAAAAAADGGDEAVFTVGTLADLAKGSLALPLPSLEADGLYRSPVDAPNAACISVPADPTDPHRTGDILTAYFTESTDSIAAPLREWLTVEHESDLLDLILASRTCALGALFGWGDLAEALTESVGVREADFLASVEMRMVTAARAMEIFLSRLK